MRGCSYFRGIPIVLKICINKKHTMSQILKSSVAKKKKKSVLYIPKGTALGVIQVHSSSLNLEGTLRNSF